MLFEKRDYILAAFAVFTKDILSAEAKDMEDLVSTSQYARINNLLNSLVNAYNNADVKELNIALATDLLSILETL